MIHGRECGRARTRKVGQTLVRGTNIPAPFYISGRKERNMEEVVQFATNLISNVGFPIACVVVMFYMQNKEREAHKAESAAWVEALNRNTAVMQKVLEKLGV